MPGIKDQIGSLLVVAVAFLASVWLHDKSEAAAREAMLVPPPEYIERMQFGFKESAADSIWIRWIQDSDTCYTYLAPMEKLVAIPIAESEDKVMANPRHKKCDQSWAFKMLDAVTKLDPRFKMPYEFGAVMLSVIVEDYEGTSIIFDRGIEMYPNDWQVLYRAAYHFQFDRQDIPKAAELLKRAAANGAPPWLNALASRLYTRMGQLELGLRALEDYRKTFAADNEANAKVIDERIAKLKAEMEKEKQR